jgi:putative ABC transport system ATP-binding protein
MYDFDERPERAMQLLRLVGLEAFATKLPALVSTGQQQSAAIARALACDPPVLVADEPTGNLDSKSAGTIIDLFERLSEQGKTIAMVTHDPSLTSRTTRTIGICDGEQIDAAISRAIPQLRHRHMLEMTKQASRRLAVPFEVILEHGAVVNDLYFIKSGFVDVLACSGSQEQPVSRLGPGELFGEIELMLERPSLACVRAGDQPVELLTYPRRDFQAILKESPITAQALNKVVEARLAEYNRLVPGGEASTR